MADKIATIHWERRGKQHVGKIGTQTEASRGYPCEFASRFEDDRRGTHPDELAAARDACCTMVLSFACDAAGAAQNYPLSKALASVPEMTFVAVLTQ